MGHKGAKGAKNAMIQMVRLGDVAHINPRFDKSSLADDVPVSFVQMASVGAADGEINVSIVRPFAEVKKGSYTPFKDGDVLFAKVTPCMENGKMAVARGLKNGVGFGSSEFHVLRPSDKVDAKYLYHFVSSQAFRKEAAGHMTGAVGLRRVPAAFLADKVIPLVPMDEQRRIVAEIEQQFSRLGVAVANLQRVKANLKRYKASVLKAAVEGRLVETEASIAKREGRSYETGEQLLDKALRSRRIKWDRRGQYVEPTAVDASNLPALPEGWTWTTVAQLGFVRGGKRLPAGHKYSEQQTMYPYIRVTDFREYGVDASSLQYLTAETQNEIQRYTITCNDVYISIAGSIGLVGIVPEAISGANLTENAAKITGLEQVNNKYLMYWLSSGDGVNAISDSTIATTQAKLALYRIERIPVPLPPLAEQARIVAEIDCHLSIIREVEAEIDTNLQRAQALRQATLGTAFRY